jgi:hypothetical protein
VFPADVYDALFTGLVDANDEGKLVRTGRGRPTAHLPFTEQTVTELIGAGRLAPAAAGCLELAWRHRRTLLA